MQSPTDGEVAIHHFAESGVMELVEVTLTKGMPFEKIDVVGNFSEIVGL